LNSLNYCRFSIVEDGLRLSEILLRFFYRSSNLKKKYNQKRKKNDSNDSVQKTVHNCLKPNLVSSCFKLFQAVSSCFKNGFLNELNYCWFWLAYSWDSFRSSKRNLKKNDQKRKKWLETFANDFAMRFPCRLMEEEEEEEEEEEIEEEEEERKINFCSFAFLSISLWSWPYFHGLPSTSSTHSSLSLLLSIYLYLPISTYIYLYLPISISSFSSIHLSYYFFNFFLKVL